MTVSTRSHVDALAQLLEESPGTIPLVLAGRSVLKSVGRHAEAAGSAFAAAPDYHPFFIPDPIVGTLLAFAVGIAGIAVATTGWQRVRF